MNDDESAPMSLGIGVPTSFLCDSFRLYGMIHPSRDPNQRPSTGVVMLNPGPTDRAGAHRFSIKLAERFAGMGYPTLRFDPRGTGESEGDWDPGFDGKPILNPYDEVERGVWIPDTHAAIEHLTQASGVSSVVLGGVCGGAITALLAGAEHPRVDGIFMIGNPVTLSRQTLTDISMLPQQTLDDELGRYLGKLLRPSAWMRLIGLRTDFRTLCGVLANRARLLLPGGRRGLERAPVEALSPPFARAFQMAVLHRKRLLFVYSTNDYHWHEFQEYFLATRSEIERRAFELSCIADANHNLTEERWQEELYGILLPWQGATASRGATQ